MTRLFQKDLTRALTFIFLCVSTLSFAVTSPIRPNDYTDKIRVACVGDSITYGSKIEDRQTNSYPAQLQALLGDRYDVRNFGHSGARVTKDSRKPYVGFPEYAAAIEFKPHVVIICLGINDVSVKEWQRNKPQFVQNYKELITDFQTLPVLPKPKVWLGSLMPVVPPYEPYVAIQKTKAEADMMIDQIAEELGLPLIDLFTRLNMEPQFFPDGLHPDKNGAAIIAQMTCNAITGDFGGLRMPWVFGDHMVLQRQILIPVFGTADAGSVVSVELGSNKRKVTVDHNGRWRVDMPAMQTGRAQTLTCSDGMTELTFSDVLIGEVWYASGQSNMDWQMRQDADWAAEGPLADEYPDVRLLNRQGNPSGGAGKWSQTQIDNVTVDSYYSGQWQIGSQKSAAPISAVAYYFGREIHKATGVPVGIIDNSKGGAPMEAFMPQEALATKELYGLTKDWINAETANNWHRGRARQNLARWFESPQNSPMPHHPFEPTFLFNADTADVIPFAIRGVIWYQGESNATDSTQRIAWDQEHNRRLFEGLITSWRQRWDQGNLPFYYVQLPNLNRNWMLFREMQLQTLNALPNLGMAVTIDLGHPTNVHPKAKQEVARRLSLWARAKSYGENNLIYSGPLYNGAFADEGKKLRIGFDHTAQGLSTSDNDPVKGFEIADKFGIWHPAGAKIEGDQVVVFSSKAGLPQAVRYAWSPNPKANLCNSEKLPASPFRAGNFQFKQKPTSQDSDISSPTIVGIPPVDAGRGLIRVSDTEIRHYGGRGTKIYLVSYDNGRTWQEKPLPENYPDLIGLTKEGPSFARIPGTDEFLRASHSSKGKLYRTEGGLDGQWVVIKDKDGNENPFQGILHHPLFAKNGKRWIIPAHRGGMWVYYSDDQGKTWNRSNRVHTPPHRPGGIHKGTRWNHDAAEPCIVRLNDGRLWRLIRCAQDNHYESFSSDDGQTWTEPVPSRFYGTITMPNVGRLRDGRLLMVWNNTTPLPELERATGRGEDVFTNRDVLHAAISEDDGKTWIGFREVILDEHRNDSDYAVTAGSNDRGKQQNEFLELEDGVVLLAIGQHPLHRKLMIMDIAWLYETSRTDDFSSGLKGGWSVHKFIKGIRGHCGYNRKQGAGLVPHPDDKNKQVLHVRRSNDSELVCENDGAVWNFPAGKSGVFTTRIQLQKGFKGGRIALIDRWFSPTDLTANMFAMFNLEIPADGKINDQTTLKEGQWVELKFEWDGLDQPDTDVCTFYVDNVAQAKKLRLNRQSPNGISYVHFMSTASEIDTAGFLIESVVSKTKQLQKETSSSGISSPTYISKSNEDQCQTYRIPSLVTAPDGTLICAVEARWKYKGDYGDGKISLAVKRSQDGGETWA